MKILSACVLLVALETMPASAQPPAAPSAAPERAANPPRVTSPEVGPDRRVTFRLQAPKATDVLVSGEFMRGSTKLTKNEQGVWSATVGPLEPEIYHYTFTMDGVRTIDPGNAEVKTGSTAGTIASILEVRGQTPAFYDGQDVPHGDVRAHWYQSKTLGTLRRVTVYVPPGYDRNPGARLPVLYLLHGANADETAWQRLGRANLILDNLLAAKKIKPFLVVMPFGYGVMPGTGGAPGQNTAQFGKDLLEDLIPFVQSRYRTRTDRAQRAIVGLSMGGGQALSIGLNHIDLFGAVGGFSSGLGRPADFPTTYAGLIADPPSSNKRLRLLWVGCGKDDGAFAASRSFSEFLTANKIVHTFRESDGAHTWMVWRRYLNEVAPLLFKS
jgi:enterochelin esterase family protein